MGIITSRRLAVHALLATAFFILGCGGPSEKRLLVFTKTTGYRHSSITNGTAALQRLGEQHGFLIDTTSDGAQFTEKNLARYQAVVFLSTTGDILDDQQQNAFERYIQAGGGFVGIHGAADAEYAWPWYNQLVGAYFASHPAIQPATLVVAKQGHPSTDSLPAQWQRTDEFYNFKSIQPDLQVVLTIDEKSYQGGQNGDQHPIAWYHDFDGGRAFYTSLGHTDSSWSEPAFLNHLWGGIVYATGGDRPVSINYRKAKTLARPDEFRFTKVVLDEGLDEPLEMSVLKDGRVIFVQRKGQVMLYSPVTKKSTQIATIPVAPKSEDGLLGVAVDPKFDENGWVYLYYSPVGEKPENLLVRVTMKGDSLDLANQKVLLSVTTQRDQCCHTGGGMIFDDHGNLFLSTGDNTNPFASNGYSPSDERPGRSAWDAQRSSGNTNDLRGKILRIHPEPDGTYTIPEGNLFPKGMAGTRPEIYAMGTRNPYRLSYDRKTGFIYWGEVGPDAGHDTNTRGPRGHDEINQARKAGFFGWPYFVGNNKPYVHYNFADSTSHETWDPNKPINKSPNNTGLEELPPATSAFIWYPYAESAEFPAVGTGGRTAMAGPVYRAEDFKGAKGRFPDYYNGKLFIYEFSRGWLMTVAIDDSGNYAGMEQFMPSEKFAAPMDMKFGPDGSLYLIEYGSGWFSANADARLVRIEYNGGNRAPVAQLAVDTNVGAAPLPVAFTSQGTKDHDGDSLRYEWAITKSGTSQVAKLTGPAPNHTFQEPGVYQVILTATDKAGAKGTAETSIEVGNQPPLASFEVVGNKTFYQPGQPIHYLLTVNDKEDGTLRGRDVPAGQLTLTADYQEWGFERLTQRRQAQTPQRLGAKELIDKNDCAVCHNETATSIGPTFRAIALKYEKERDVAVRLGKKVISGGSGVWGERTMTAHPKLTLAEATDMVRYILSQTRDPIPVRTLPAEGVYPTDSPPKARERGGFVLRASFTDKGANGIKPKTASALYVLRNPTVNATSSDTAQGTARTRLDTIPYEGVTANAAGAYLGFNALDLTGVTGITFDVMAPAGESRGGTIEARLDGPSGPVVASAVVSPKGGSAKGKVVRQKIARPIKAVDGVHSLYLVFSAPAGAGDKPLMTLATVRFALTTLPQRVSSR